MLMNQPLKLQRFSRREDGMTTPLSVLILEDRPADAELVLHQLRRAGFEPAWERVETEADYLSRLDPALDVILADYAMSRFDSPRALQLLQERGLDIPFIIVSGTIGEEAAVAAMRRGAADCLLKDRLARLGPAVTRSLEQKQLRDQRARADEALRESESFTKKVLESSHAGIYIYDLEKENHIFINQPYTRLTGYTLEDLHAMDSAEFVGLRHPDDQPRFAPHFERIAQARDGDFPEIEYRFSTAGGSWIWCLSRDAIFQRDDEGNRQQLIGTFLEVTERVEAQEELRRHRERLEELVEERTQELRDAQEQLVRREKLAVLGQLAGGVAHELRNPLGVISNAAYYLKMVHPDADDTTKEYLDMISSEVHGAEKIISDLLDYAHTW